MFIIFIATVSICNLITFPSYESNSFHFNKKVYSLHRQFVRNHRTSWSVKSIIQQRVLTLEVLMFLSLKGQSE